MTNTERLVSWLGVRLPSLPQMALCRCGASALKPFCDGAHAEVGFTDEGPKRVLDRRDVYVGQQVTIFDNRGTCAHSGFCSDRLRTVFRLDQEPFVAPSGGRWTRSSLPYGRAPLAPELGLGGHEAREHVDQEREQAIEVSKDGPYRVTGGIPLEDADGNPERRNEGASLEHYSLCRCGHSRNKPFCSGRHWQIGFRDPGPDPEQEPTLFEWAGGLPALTRMTRIFYGKYVPEDPLLGPLFANMSPDHPERVAAWLGEVFGGPKAYSEGYGGYERMVSQHLGKALREEQRARWVELLCKSADDAKLPADAEWRAAFVAYLEWGSRIGLENSQPGAHPPPHMPVPRWWWVCDATPSRRVSALAAEEPEQQVDLPGPMSRSASCSTSSRSSARRPAIHALRLRPLVARGRRQARGRDFRSPPGRDDALRRCLARRAGRGVQALGGLRQGRVDERSDEMSGAIDVLNPDKPKRVLVLASNPAVSEQTGWPIGFWWAELTHPYWEFVEHGYEVDVASPEGGALQG